MKKHWWKTDNISIEEKSPALKFGEHPRTAQVSLVTWKNNGPFHCGFYSSHVVQACTGFPQFGMSDFNLHTNDKCVHLIMNRKLDVLCDSKLKILGISFKIKPERFC